jgi:hypothetical protein
MICFPSTLPIPPIVSEYYRFDDTSLNIFIFLQMTQVIAMATKIRVSTFLNIFVLKEPHCIELCVKSMSNSSLKDCHCK